VRRAFLAIFVLWLTAACATPAPPPEVRWVKQGAGEADLEIDREACFREAAGTTSEKKRVDHIAKGSAFLRCMTSRGWQQEAVE